MNLSKIQLINFKSHKKSVVETKKITILIGPTNSGKSSILQSLLILRDTFYQGESNFVTDGRTYDYGKFEDIVIEGKENQNISISIDGIKGLGKYVPKEDYIDTKFHYEVSGGKTGRNHVALRVEIGIIGIDFKYSTTDGFKAYSWEKEQNINFTVDNIDLNGINPKMRVHVDDKLKKSIFDKLFLNGDYTKILLDEFYYIPFSRVITAYSLPIEHSNEILSTNQQKSASALLSKISANPKLRRKISKYISQIGNKTIETRNIETFGQDLSRVTLDFVSKEFSNAIIHEGSGLNQLVLLLAILVDAPKKSIIAIEEPELHLDPASQSKLINIILEEVKNEEKQIIFTTHSEHMLYPILAQISKEDGILTKEDVAIYYFNLDDEGKLTEIENLEINEHGQIKGGLKGFWDIDANTMSEIIGKPND